MDDDKIALKEARKLAKAGQSQEAITALAGKGREGIIQNESLLTAGRFIQKHSNQTNPYSRILILGQCTTNWIKDGLSAVSYIENLPSSIEEGSYDNIIQDIYQISEHPQKPDIVILLPWNKRLLNDNGRSPQESIELEIDFWQGVWSILTKQMNTRILQIAYDWSEAGPLGYHLSGEQGDIHIVSECNKRLKSSLPKGSAWLDLPNISGFYGRENFYDYRRYLWTKQPFSESGVDKLSRHLFSRIRAMISGPKKVLVTDLDNTLWGGVVGELGPHQIKLGGDAAGDAFIDYQKFLKGLSKRGIILAVASKNNLKDAIEAFEKNDQMVLSLDDISCFQASWEPKSIMLKNIANKLNLGTDSFIFVDDNPAEREQIRQSMPEVSIPNISDDPAEYVQIIQQGLWFEALTLSNEDAKRSKQYQQENIRQESKAKFASLDDYLSSLKMKADLAPISECNILRVVQLLAKTNQFNLTTKRHSREEVEALIAGPESVSLTMSMQDKFGDYGLISLIIGVPHESKDTIMIDSWLMSCRVIGRTSEQFMFNAFCQEARRKGFKSVIGVYSESAKNALVSDLFERLGFTIMHRSESSNSQNYKLELTQQPATTFIQKS